MTCSDAVALMAGVGLDATGLLGLLEVVCCCCSALTNWMFESNLKVGELLGEL